MPDIPVSSPLSYIGVFFLLFGFFLVLAGLRIFKVEKITVTPGARTWGIGVILALLGLAFLLPDILKALVQPSTTTSTATIPESTTSGIATPLTDMAEPIKILFDEMHSERNTLSWEYAQSLNPENPEFIYFGALNEALSDSYIFERNVNSPLSPELFKAFNALILPAPTKPLSPSELAATNEYLTNGGGLVVLGDCGIDDNVINALIMPYSITFDTRCLFVSDREGDFTLETFLEHEVTSTSTFVTNWSGSLIVEGSAIALASTGNEVRQDTNWNGKSDPQEPEGPFVIIAVNEVGRGRIVVIADNPFQDDGFVWRLNHMFMRSVLDWITGSN